MSTAEGLEDDSLNYTHAEGCSKLYYLIHLESIYAGYLDQIHLDLIHGKCCWKHGSMIAVSISI